VLGSIIFSFFGQWEGGDIALLGRGFHSSV
jgi:hypothetical protein